MGYRLTFLPLSDDIEIDYDFEFLSAHAPFVEYALRCFEAYQPETPSVWRFDGDSWESEQEFVRKGLSGRYAVMWWDE